MKTGNHFKSGMLRKSLFILAAVILFSLLFACKKKNEGLLELDSNGKYTPVDGDLYIGIIYRFEADRDATLELYTICDASGNVSDCGKNCHTDEPFDKERYIGMNYIDAFDLFLHDHEKQVEGRKREMIDVPILEGDENRDKYSEKFGALADRNGFPHEVGFVSEDKKRFLDIIANSTEEQVRRLAEEEARKEEEERLRKEEEERRKNEPEKSEEPPIDPNAPADVASQADLEKLYKEGHYIFNQTADFTIDLGKSNIDGIHMECNGHALTVKGTIKEGGKAGREGGVAVMEIFNSGRLDLSRITFDESSFDPDKWVGSFCHIEVYETNINNIILPAGIINRQEIDPKCPYKGYVYYDTNQEGTALGIGYNGPEISYEDLQVQEKTLVEEILTLGQTADYGQGDQGGGFSRDIWTKVELDMGSVDLPNQDYMHLKLMPGAYLKVTGTIGVTGGRLGWEVTEADQLDITGLTLVKKHPSPDVMKIDFNPSEGIVDDMVKPKAGNGKISISKGSDSVAITIW